ncbi:Mob1 [Capsaspora owczarzaki ATCC 30864]|uniref:Mob1 n=1 Tax=Capsaspora owczarzaki (strain ATCC 30864) TaxID=595528 RepID=E9C5Q2_CAPO3|nr:Mob1 [Capsaspora owczarzaki ATCC 30864]XP_004364159.1 Mob1 [Capsaspora owczarzaki ATCC 30864]KJE92333.1 Mob1 [Capsaspora owczarzaki ATCC 30864]KJE98383.1 Mob1 [Capsaspora owczarzaki ATCC 30864]|eukprot:XP_004340838.1 Mob1 [Capsaspora owczarzaki ATCC 30864]
MSVVEKFRRASQRLSSVRKRAVSESMGSSRSSSMYNPARPFAAGPSASSSSASASAAAGSGTASGAAAAAAATSSSSSSSFTGPMSLDALRAIVALPEGSTINEWLALNTVDFYNQINLIYATLSEFCTAETCPSMTAGDAFEFYWADESGESEPVKVSAPEYVENLMAWVSDQLNDPVIFPPEDYVLEYPPMFPLIVKTIFRRLFRVFAHIYCSHFESVITIGLLAVLNMRFRHFLCFVIQFDLVDRSQLMLLKNVIEEMLDLQIFDRRTLYHQQEKLGASKSRKDVESTVFGIALADLVERERIFDDNNRAVPLVVLKCVEHMEKIEGYQREGIFRKSTGVHKINKLKQLFDENASEVNLQTQEFSYDIHAVACLLKLYFRELPEPLLLNTHYEQWRQACKFDEEPRRLLEIRYLLQSLPRSHYTSLKFTMKFLKKVADHSYVNKMTANNLAIVLCPVFLWDKKITATSMITESSECALVIETMILHTDSLFTDEDDDEVRLAEKGQHADSSDESDSEAANAPPVSAPPTKAPATATVRRVSVDSALDALDAAFGEAESDDDHLQPEADADAKHEAEARFERVPASDQTHDGRGFDEKRASVSQSDAHNEQSESAPDSQRKPAFESAPEGEQQPQQPVADESIPDGDTEL